MIIDSKGKLFGKISIVDILIVFVLIAAIAGLGYKYMKSKTANPLSGKADSLQITFYVEEMPEYGAKAIKAGDIVKDGVTGAVFGKVTDIKIDKSVSWAQSGSGEWVASTKKGYSSILLTVEGNGIYGNSGVTFDGTPYFIGIQLERLRAGNVGIQFSNSKIYDIKKKG